MSEIHNLDINTPTPVGTPSDVPSHCGLEKQPLTWALSEFSTIHSLYYCYYR